MRRRTQARVGAAALGLALTGAAPALADYTARGRFLYEDREFGASGFTGNQPLLPIRLADVEVLDANSQNLLASGATDSQGNFTIPVAENTTRNVYVRVKTTGARTPGLYLRVLQNTTTNSAYAVASQTYAPHASNADIDFTGSPVVALAPTLLTPQGGGGPQFNIYDTLLDGLDFIASQSGGH